MEATTGLGENIHHGPQIEILSKQKGTLCQRVVNTIKKMAQFIFYAVMATFCFWINPTIFAISFFVGIACSHRVKKTIKKIERVIQHQTLPFLAIGGFALFLSLPVSLAVASSLWAAHLGATLAKQSKEQEEKAASAT